MPKTTIAFILLLGGSFLIGCGDDAPPPAPPQKFDYAVEVAVTDGQENPLPQVAVTIDGQVVGHTDADGKFTGTINDFAEKSLELGVVAPPGYRFAPDTDKVTEMLRTTTVNGQQSGVPLYLAAQAESLQSDYLIWVKAVCEGNLSCADWPVTLDGEEKARTNALGYAHFSFTGQPRNDVEIAIGTPAKTSPANPTYTVSLDVDASVYRLEQSFVDPTAPKRTARPVRVAKKGGGGKKGDKKPDAEAKVPAPGDFVDPTPKKKDDGVIDLF